MNTTARHRHILRVTIGYGIIAALWILLSDALLAPLLDPAAIERLSLIKGLLFVLVTTLLLYYALGGVPDRADSGPAAISQAIRPSGAPWSGGWIYLFAVTATLGVLLLRLAVPVPMAEQPMMVIFMLPIILSAMAGGLGPGLVATLLASLAVDFYAVEPLHSFRIAQAHDFFQWCFLLADGILISILSQLLHRQRRQTESSCQLQTVTLASIGDGVITTDQGGYVTFLNSEAERLTGWSGSEAVGQPLVEIFRIVTGDHRQPNSDPVAEILATNTGKEVMDQGFLLTRDGRELPIQASGAPISLANGTLQGVVVIFRDDTLRRRSEARVQEERALYQDLVNNQPGGIYRIRVHPGRAWELSASGEVPYEFEIISEHFCEILGVSRGDLETDPGLIGRRIHPDDQDNFNQINAEANASLTPFNWEGRMLNAGRCQWVQFQSLPRRLDNGDILWTGLLTDISARKQSEISLRESQAQFALLAGLLERSSQPFSQGFPDGRLGFVNHAYLELTGYSAEEVVNLNWQKLTAPECREKEQAVLEQLHTTGHPVRYEKEYIRKDGSRVPIEILVHLARDEEGNPLYYYSFFTDLTARKKAEQALRESEKTYHSLVENMLDGVAHVRMIFDGDLPIDFEYLAANQAFASVTGLSGNLVGRRISEVIPGYCRDNPESLEMFGRVAVSGKATRWEHYLAALDRWFSFALYSPARGEVVIVVDNITEQKKADLRLQESEKTYRTLFDNMLNGLAYCRMEFVGDDPVDFVYLTVNDAFEKLTGLKDVEGRRVGELIPGIRQTDPEIFARYGRVARGGEPERFEIYIESLQMWFWLSVYSPKPDHFVAIFDVITERKQAEIKLQESEARLRAISDNLPDGYIYQSGPGEDGQPRFHYISAGVGEIHGLTPEEVMADATLLYRQVDPAQVETLAQAERESFRNSTDFNYELHVRRPDATWRWLSIHSRPHRKPNGQLVWDGVATDITARKALEGQLFQAQKMEFVGRLAGGVAHDFNNMLTVIGGHTELALLQTPPDDPRYASLQEIQGATRRSTNLTRQLLAFARKQTVSPKVLDLNDTLGSMLKMLQRLIGENIDLAWLPGHELWPVKIDPSQIDQLLANLAVNARDAIAGVGKVTIETANHSLDADYCAAHPDVLPGEYVELAVSDSGTGMDGEVLAHLFEPFYTTKKEGEGTGLGLATVYGIVKQNGGTINVYSETDKGTTFRIYLPRHAESLDSAQESSIPPPAPGGAETVLLVEDDPAILDLGKRFIEKLGYRILTANSPAEAIRLVEDYREGAIDLLISDVVMPEMNGKQLATRLKALLPELKCLFMSGYTADAIARQGVLDDGICFLPKPFSSGEMAVKIREALEKEECGQKN